MSEPKNVIVIPFQSSRLEKLLVVFVHMKLNIESPETLYQNHLSNSRAVTKLFVTNV